MNELYKLEQCPRAKQDLLKVVNQIKMREEFERLSKICRCDDAGVPRCGTCEKLRKAKSDS